MPEQEPQQPKVSLDDFLMGRPLTPEHAELMAAAEEAEETPVRTMQETDITEDDRYYLGTLVTTPGWEAAVRVFDNAILRQEKSATLLSQTDPLKDKDEIAVQWAYVVCMRYARRKLLAAVEAELGKAKGDLHG